MKLATIALAFLLAASLAACNRQSDDAPAKTPATGSSTGPATAPPASPAASPAPPPPTTASPTERKDGHPPIQGQVDPKSSPQQKDFEVKK